MPGFIASRSKYHLSYEERSEGIIGRGPTRLISPLSTLNSWGSSSKLERLRYLPTRVIRGSASVLYRTGREVSEALELRRASPAVQRSEEHTSELQSPDHLVCRLLLEKK